MEKSQAYIIATAIVVAGLIVAAAVLGVEKPGRYVALDANGLFVLDTQSGQTWAVQSDSVSGPTLRTPWFANRD